MKAPRQYSLVKLNDDAIHYFSKGTFEKTDTRFVFLGEIPNMLGHCVIIGKYSGRIYTGFPRLPILFLMA